MKIIVLLICVTLSCPICCRADNPVSIDFGPDGNSVDSRVKQPKFSKAHSRAKMKQVYTLRVISVNVEGRWNAPAELPLAVGDLLTPEKIFDSMEALEKTITGNSINGYGLRSKGEIGVLFIEVDFDTNRPSADAKAPGKNVAVTFRPHYVQFSLISIGDNVLPIPRSSLPTFYNNVPRALLALNPTIGASYDRSFGTAIGGALEADLLNLADPAHLSNSTDKNRHVTVQTHGMKSLQDQFYRYNAGINYVDRQIGTVLREFSLRADNHGVNEPLGSEIHQRNAFSGQTGVMLKLASNVHLSLDTGYRRSDDRMDSTKSAVKNRTSANEQINRLLIRCNPSGYLRISAGCSLGGQRLAGRFGKTLSAIGDAHRVCQRDTAETQRNYWL